MAFTLEVKFSGLVLLDQQAAGAAPHAKDGLSLYLMQHSTHRPLLKVRIAQGTSGPGASIPLSGVYDYYGKGGAVQSTIGLADLSKVNNKKESVHADWLTATPPAGLLARMRFPLANSLAPAGKIVELEFNSGFANAMTDIVSGAGLFTTTIDANELQVGAERLQPVGGFMAVCIENHPYPDDAPVPVGTLLTNHHLHAALSLLAKPGSVAHLHLPVRYLSDPFDVRPEPHCSAPHHGFVDVTGDTPAASGDEVPGVAAEFEPPPMFGGDPVQCTSGTI